MKEAMQELFAARVRDFRLPRFHELPNVGLYLEQVVKFVNGTLSPLGCPELTASMVSNYVKKGVIDAPLKKQYDAEQIAYLIFIGIGKSVLSMENIALLFSMQKDTYPGATAYNYFCMELENMLLHIAGLKDTIDQIGVTTSQAKTLLRSVIISASHILFVSNSFRALQDKQK